MSALAIDAMGGDMGLECTVPACLDFLDRNPGPELILVGRESEISATLSRLGRSTSDRLSIVHATEVVGMDESPANALRHKKDSSMRVAINLVKEGRAAGCVSAGNTGALMATARFVLKTLKGIDRPAICAALPRGDGQTHVLDLGANTDTPPEILLQFGVMGTQLIQSRHGKQSPSVGLLNIGVEEIKGNDQIRATAALFRESDLNYIGFVEADDIYMGDTDLVVCDGVLGNVALKASEGVAQMIMGVMREEFSHSLLTKACGVAAMPVLKSIRNRLDPRRYNGASLLGLRGTVVKSHGGTDSLGFGNAIGVAWEEVHNGLVGQIEDAIS